MFSDSFKVITQGGSRRGANMGVLWYDHPEIFDFIRYKAEHPGSWHMFNVSVGIDAVFVKALKENGVIHQRFGYDSVPARRIWEAICEYAPTGEPGIIKFHTCNEWNNLHYIQQYRASNPCSEVPLPPNGVCCLGSINLFKHVDKEGTGWDFDLLGKSVRGAVRFLDNVLSMNYYPYPEMANVSSNERRIGLGTIGFADALLRMGCRYGSEKSLSYLGQAYEYIRDIAYDESVVLAREKGKFPLYGPSYCNSKFIQTLPKYLQNDIRKYGTRNSHLLATAPTGSISVLAQCASNGIEPIFSFDMVRKDGTGTFRVVHPIIEEISPVVGEDDYIVDAHEVTPDQHLAVLRTCQKYVDQGVSKTINIPQNFDQDDLEDTIESALNDPIIKSITLYADQSIKDQPLSRVDKPPTTHITILDEFGTTSPDKEKTWV